MLCSLVLCCLVLPGLPLSLTDVKALKMFLSASHLCPSLSCSLLSPSLSSRPLLSLTPEHRKWKSDRRIVLGLCWVRLALNMSLSLYLSPMPCRQSVYLFCSKTCSFAHVPSYPKHFKSLIMAHTHTCTLHSQTQVSYPLSTLRKLTVCRMIFMTFLCERTFFSCPHTLPSSPPFPPSSPQLVAS